MRLHPELRSALLEAEPGRLRTPEGMAQAGGRFAEAVSFLSFTRPFIFLAGDTESGWDDTAVATDLSSTSSGTESSPQSPLTPDGKRSPKGIKKFWGK